MQIISNLKYSTPLSYEFIKPTNAIPIGVPLGSQISSKINKPFEKVFMDTLKLFMAIPGKVNFLQMGRYGESSEQACRNNFENETFDWFAFNEHLIRKTLTGKFLTIAVNPCFLPKSGKKTPWIGRFWSGVAGEMKLGQEVSGVGVIDVDNRDCMTLSAIQPPDTKSLE